MFSRKKYFETSLNNSILVVLELFIITTAHMHEKKKNINTYTQMSCRDMKTVEDGDGSIH